MSYSCRNPLSPTPLIVKLGGSLYNQVPALVPIFQESPRPLLIVPGGGQFADAVREAALPDDQAHWLAVGAMDQFGKYLGSQGMVTSDVMQTPEKSTVFLPCRTMRHYDPLPHSWDVTSDTIAAWVADQLGLELLIVKSVEGILQEGVLADTVTEPISTDVVDPCCIPYILDHRIRATIISGLFPDRVARFLQGERIPCTRIGTTF